MPPQPSRLAEMMRASGMEPALPPALAGLEIGGLTADSRRVRPGDLFAALPGARADGRAFIADAVARGAAAVLAPPGTAWPDGVPVRPMIEDPEPRRALARLAAVHAGPAPRTLVAITGTNGKTSTAEFLRQIWSAEVPAASLGTLGIVAPGYEVELPGGALTTPDPVALAAALAALARRGVRRAAIEASSHGLDQFRLDGLRFAAAGFSNLTRDHLDYHRDMSAYRAAKLRLFDALVPEGAPVVAQSDADRDSLEALRAVAARRHLRLSLVGEGGRLIRLLGVVPRADGQVLTVEYDGMRRDVMLNLPGRFQADNALLAAGLAHVTGTAEVLERVGRLAGVRGRLELAARLANGAAAYVDYAHTPDALARLLVALRPHTAGRLVVVFGAGGDRDRGKRPLMGEVAARLADLAIVTDDNPRGEDASAIREAVLSGCPGGIGIAGRARAIAAGLGALRPGDVLAVAGKGHEQGQTIGDETLPFDDVAVLRRLAGGPG